MIKPKLLNLFLIFLVLINLIYASSSDGFCTFQETYLDTVTERKIISVPHTELCGSYKNISCPYQNQSISIPTQVLKARITKKCCDGYLKKRSNCIPDCHIQCKNAQCTRPNECTCDPGYERSVDWHRCKPICNAGYKYNDEAFEFNDISKQCIATCDEGCVNSDCTSPNVCTCRIGFSKFNSTHCEIPCENCSDNYSCEMRNVCQCLLSFGPASYASCVIQIIIIVALFIAICGACIFLYKSSVKGTQYNSCECFI